MTAEERLKAVRKSAKRTHRAILRADVRYFCCKLLRRPRAVNTSGLIKFDRSNAKALIEQLEKMAAAAEHAAAALDF